MGFRGQRPGIEGGDGLPDFAAVGVKTLDIYTAVFRPPAHRAASRTALMNKLVAVPKISPFSLTSPPHWIARSIADGMVMNEQGV